jgi:hypothetical protein
MADEIIGIQTRTFWALAAAVLIAAAGVVTGVMGLSRTGDVAARVEAVKSGVDKKLTDAGIEATTRAEDAEKKLDKRVRDLDARIGDLQKDIEKLRETQKDADRVMTETVDQKAKVRVDAASAQLRQEEESRINIARREVIKDLQTLRTEMDGVHQGLESRVRQLEVKYK